MGEAELLLPSKLLRNVVQYDLLLLFIINAFLLPLEGVVFAKVFYVLRVYQVLLACILVVVLFEMMYLILIFIVTVMSGSKTKVRQLFAVLRMAEEGFSRDAATMLGIKDLENFYDG